MVSEPLLSGWLNMSREEGERTGSLRSNRDREWLIFAVVDSREQHSHTHSTST